MTWPLLNFKQIPVDDQSWTLIAFPCGGLLFKAWLEFSADLKLRSDPADATTEKVLSVSKGDEFVMDCLVPLSLASGAELIYAQSVSGAQMLALGYFMFRGV